LSKSLKSTIQLDLDPSGVVKGVAATNRELTKLNRSASRTAGATSIMAGFSMIQAAFSAIRGIVNAVNEDVQRLNQLGQRFSPEGMASKAALDIAKFNAEMQTGKAFGVSGAAAANLERENVERRQAREVANAPDLAAGNAFWTSLGNTISDTWNAAWTQFKVNLANPDSDTTFTGAALEAAGLPQFLAGEGYSQGYTAGGSARGMPYDPDMMARQTRALESIEQKLGGK
jgi:hypothetical protein